MFNCLSNLTKFASLYSGNRFYPFNPIGMQLVSKIELIDVAHSLSNICRFNGHCSEFYSVAQHSVHVAELVTDKRLRLAALLHDASETYTGDVVSPFKRMFAGLVRLERRLQVQIYDRFDIALSEKDEVIIKRADLVALATEKRDLMPRQKNETWTYIHEYEPDERTIIPLLPNEAKKIFMEKFFEYGGFALSEAA